MHLAVLLAAAATTGKPWALEWLTIHVLWQIIGGIGGGWLIGRVFGWLTFHVSAETKLSRTGDGLIAIAATLLSYGLVETIHAYGFLSVFVTALTFRHAHREHEFHHEMHAITEQIERLAMMVLLILFGGALVSGLLAHVSWIDGLAAAIMLLINSIFYIAYGVNHMAVPGAERLWGIVGLVILFSILLHGLTVTPIMRSLDHRFGREPS